MSIGDALLFEAFASLHMSVGVLYPLAKKRHPDESKKYFIRYFLIRAIILILGNFITPYFAILDFIVMFIGVFILVGTRSVSRTVSNTKPEDIDLAKIYTDYHEKQALDENIPDLSTIFPDYKEEIFEDNKPIFNNKYNSVETLLDEYISQALENKEDYVAENIKQINIARIILSLITFLNISYMCVYHRNFSVCFIIQIIAILIYRSSIKNMNIFSYIKKQIKARPDDNMDYIIASAKQNIISKADLTSKVILPITLIICAILFLRPHIIYEKKDDGYAVRYYTLAIFNDSHVEIPDEYKGKKVIEIRGDTFANLKSLETISLPKYIKEIRGNTFENSGLKVIAIPNGVTRIGGRAFFDCDDLESVILPSTLNEIGSSAFRNCDSLYNIKIPKRTIINEKAFKESPTRIERY